MSPTEPSAAPHSGSSESGTFGRKFRRVARAVLRFVVGLAAALLLVVSAVLVSLQTDWGRGLLLRNLLPTLNGLFTGTIEVDRLDGPIIGRLVLQGVRLKTADGTVALSVQQVEVKYSLMPLLKQTVDLHHIEIQTAEAQVLDHRGQVTFAEVFRPKEESPPSETPSPWVIRIGALALNHGRVALHPRPDSPELKDLRLSLALHIQNGHIGWTALSLAANTKQLPVDRVSLDTTGDFGEDTLILERLALRAGPFVVETTGTVSQLGQPAGPYLNMKLQEVSAQLDAMEVLFGTPPMKGSAHISGVVSGPLTKTQAELAVRTAGGALSIRGVVDLIDEIQADLTLYSSALSPGLVVPMLPEELSFGLNAQLGGQWTSLTQHKLRAGIVVGDLRTHVAQGSSVGVTALSHNGKWSAAVQADGPRPQSLRLVATADQILPPATVFADWEIADLDLAFWANVLALGEHSGILDHMSGHGTATLGATGISDVDAVVRLRAHALSVAESAGVAASVESADATVQALWDGAGLPTAQVEVALTGAIVDGSKIEAINCKLNAQTESGGVRTTGNIGVRNVDAPEIAMVQAVDIGLDLLLDPQTYLPSGRVHVDGVGVQTPDVLLASANLDSDVRLDQGALHWNGTVSIHQLRQGRGANAVAVHHATAKLKGNRAADGPIHTAADLRLQQIRAGQSKIQSAHTRLNVDITPGKELKVQTAGNLNARGLRITPELGVESISGSIQGHLAGKRARGWANVTAQSVRSGDLLVPKLMLDAELGSDGAIVFGLQSNNDALAALVRGRLTLPRTTRSPLEIEILEASVSRDNAGFVLSPGAKAAIGPNQALAVSGLKVRGQGELTGELAANVVSDLGSGQVDAAVKINEVQIGQWAASALHLLGKPAPELGFSGVLTADLSLKESLKAPVLDYSLSLKDGVLGNLRNVTIESSGQLANDSATLKAGLGFDPAGHVDVDLLLPIELSLMPFAFAFKPDAPIKTSLKLQSIDLADFREFAPPLPYGRPLGGNLTATIRVGGTLNAPLVDALVAAQDVSAGRIEEGKVDAQLAITPDLSRLDLRVADREGELVRLRGKLPLNLAEALSSKDVVTTLRQRMSETPVDVSLAVRTIALGKIPFWLAVDDPLADVRTAAMFVLSGTLTEPKLHGWASAHRIPIRGGGIASGLVRIDSEGEDMVATMGLSAWDQQLVDISVFLPEPAELLRGRSPLDLLRDERLSAHVMVSGVAAELLGTLSPTLASTLEQAIPGAYVDVTTAVRGAPDGPKAWVVARIEATSAPPKEATTFARAVLAQVQLGADGVQLGIAVEQFPGGYLTLNGGVDIDIEPILADQMPDFMQLPIRGKLSSLDFGFSGISALAPAIFGPSVGILDADVQLSGTVAKPELTGRISAQFEELVLAIAGIKEKNITLVLDITPQKIVLTPLQLKSEKGSLDISLELETESLKPENIYLSGDITLNRYHIARTADMDATLTGDILLAGNLASPTVQGQVEIDDAKISPNLGGRSVQTIGIPADVTFLLPSGQIPRGALGRTTRSTPGQGLNMMLTVDIPPRAVWVKDDMVDLLIGGDITVKGDNGKLTITGLIEVLEGEVMLYGRKFTLSPDSTVIFGGGEEINPELNIMANYDISNVDLSPIGLQTTDSSAVSVRVSGTAKKPRVELLSSPPMDETNIVAIVVTGTPVGAGEGQQSSLEAQTMNLFVGLATGQVAKLVQSELPIDVFRLQSSEDFTEAQVTVGKRLTRDLMLLYNANLGAPPGQNANEFRVEYAITRTLQLETRFGDAGEGGLDLIFRWRY